MGHQWFKPVCAKVTSGIELSDKNQYKINHNNNKNNNNNLWLTAPKGATPVNLTSESEWQMAVRWDSVISITLRRV